MNKEILMVVDAVSNEKGVSKEIIFEAMEIALATATKRKHGEEMDVRVSINRENGGYETFQRWAVFADDSSELEDPDKELRLEDALEISQDAKPGEFVEVPIDSVVFGRIAAQTARQVIVQKIREAEREQVIDEFQERVGSLVNGIVKRVDRGGIFVDLGGNAEGFIPRENLIPREPIKPQDRVKAILYEIKSEIRGPQLFLTRTSPEFLIQLFKLEVPEVGQDLIEILSAARDPGLRAKIVVKSNDSRIDPVGACVGMRGSRVQAVSNELAGERVDIILHDDNAAQFVINAMSPADVLSIVMDEEAHSMDIAVDEEKLSQAIGRGGQNIRLASELTGWELNVMTEKDAEEKNDQESKELINKLMDDLDVDENVASILVQEGFVSIEEVAYVPTNELLAIEEFNEEIVNELRSRARDILVTQALVNEEIIDQSGPSEDLLELDGMDKELAFELASKGVITREDLAEQSVIDLEVIKSLDAQKAAEIIMKARAHWFDDKEEKSSDKEKGNVNE
ncbi:MAG: transcription termination/antitermination protein NusA [Gammaproteobacteria bacterium TMED78]|mgnify:CR=1 FL=1|nr:MAG: transcription termination/antitermination protein NusA [Gammaproteobacteria bacterium TMED78]|tara:strand:- start:6873 stop:8408 length:1536 start_codon:yes stop_codon:yes gene_type:complete